MSQHTDCQPNPPTKGPIVERSVELKDGTIVILRALQKDDAPAVSDMFRSCTGATLRQRFQYAFKLTPEWIASRYQIDRAREIAIVAEVVSRRIRQLVGISQLVFSPKHGSFEFGILIADDWQGKGLGTLMTRYCLDVARARRVKRVIATTTPSNSRMIKVFRNEGFLFDCDWTAGVVRVHKELSPLASRSRGSHCEDTSLPRSA